MLVLVRNRLVTLNVRTVFQEYTDCNGSEHLLGLTIAGKRFHVVRNERYWELVNVR